MAVKRPTKSSPRSKTQTIKINESLKQVLWIRLYVYLWEQFEQYMWLFKSTLSIIFIEFIALVYHLLVKNNKSGKNKKINISIFLNAFHSDLTFVRNIYIQKKTILVLRHLILTWRLKWVTPIKVISIGHRLRTDTSLQRRVTYMLPFVRQTGRRNETYVSVAQWRILNAVKDFRVCQMSRPRKLNDQSPIISFLGDNDPLSVPLNDYSRLTET